MSFPSKLPNFDNRHLPMPVLPPFLGMANPGKDGSNNNQTTNNNTNTSSVIAEGPATMDNNNQYHMRQYDAVNNSSSSNIDHAASAAAITNVGISNGSSTSGIINTTTTSTIQTPVITAPPSSQGAMEVTSSPTTTTSHKLPPLNFDSANFNQRFVQQPHQHLQHLPAINSQLPGIPTITKLSTPSPISSRSHTSESQQNTNNNDIDGHAETQVLEALTRLRSSSTINSSSKASSPISSRIPSMVAPATGNQSTTSSYPPGIRPYANPNPIPTPRIVCFGLIEKDDTNIALNKEIPEVKWGCERSFESLPMLQYHLTHSNCILPFVPKGKTLEDLSQTSKMRIIEDALSNCILSNEKLAHEYRVGSPNLGLPPSSAGMMIGGSGYWGTVLSSAGVATTPNLTSSSQPSSSPQPGIPQSIQLPSIQSLGRHQPIPPLQQLSLPSPQTQHVQLQLQSPLTPQPQQVPPIGGLKPQMQITISDLVQATLKLEEEENKKNGVAEENASVVATTPAKRGKGRPRTKQPKIAKSSAGGKVSKAAAAASVKPELKGKIIKASKQAALTAPKTVPTPPTYVPITASTTSKKATKASKKPKIFKCSFCKKEFTRKSNLDSHLITHSTERPHVCQECGKSFARLSDRTRHESTTHQVIKTFQCRGIKKDGVREWGCGHYYSRADGLRKHFKSFAGKQCLYDFLRDLHGDTDELFVAFRGKPSSQDKAHHGHNSHQEKVGKGSKGAKRTEERKDVSTAARSSRTSTRKKDGNVEIAIDIDVDSGDEEDGSGGTTFDSPEMLQNVEKAIRNVRKHCGW